MPQSRGGSQNSEPTVRLAPHFLYTIETAIKRSIRWANKRILGFGCFEVSFSSAGHAAGLEMEVASSSVW